MRIIGGEARGRRLYVPRACRIRPTADRIKEAFFNIIQPMAGKSFLDLFAGTGNMGLEALSRGAAKAVFIEKEILLVDSIKKNIEVCGFTDRADLFATDAIQAIGILRSRSVAFDFIFVDPPYQEGLVNPTLEALSEGQLIAKNGLLAIQSSVREEIQDSPVGQLILTDHRRYGDTILSFFETING
jgi:16S rRNA (guanine(966)-N(2))-methyltransferase RsmD